MNTAKLRERSNAGVPALDVTSPEALTRCPGPVHTVMNDRRVAYDAQRRGVSFEEQERSMTLLGRQIEPDEIAPLAVYLASDDARMMTGQAVNLDGGICMA